MPAHRVGESMATRFQITIDCADTDLLAHFWATALHYEIQKPPAGFDSWRAFYRSIGVPEEELDDAADRIVDPDGVGPKFWFQRVPEGKIGKNRLHLDLDVAGGRQVPLATRRERVDAEAERLVRAGATVAWVHAEEGVDHYAVTMRDPEGNEFCVH